MQQMYVSVCALTALAVLSVAGTATPTGGSARVGPASGNGELDDVAFVQTRLNADSALGTQLAQLAQNVQQLGNLEQTEKQVSIDSLIESIEQDIEPSIKADKDDVQTRIDKGVMDLMTKTQTAVDLKNSTDGKDNQLLTCREQEKQAMIDTAMELDAVVAARERATQKCEDQAASKSLKWTLSESNGVCDMKHEVNCTPHAIMLELDELKRRVAKSRMLYFEKKARCRNATQDLQDLLTSKVVDQNVADKFLLKKAECDGRQRNTIVSMCMFGHRLQEKCRTKDALFALVDATRDKSRRAQWEGVQNVKCLLAAIKAGSSTVDPACTGAIDFKKDVGLVAVQDAKDVADQATSLFSCKDGESLIFSGYRWTTGESPDDYSRGVHSPKVNLASAGSYPFDFCVPSPAASDLDFPPQPQVAASDVLPSVDDSV